MKSQPAGAEEVLDRSEPHFRSLIENTWDIICVLNADGAVRYVSPSVERVLGYSPAEIIGRNGAEIVHPDDRSVASQALLEGIQRPGESRFLELRLRHKDGSWHTLEIAGKVVPNHAGAPIGIISAHDITKRTQVEAALRESEERYRLVARATSDVIWDWDVTTGTLLWNDAGPKVFRYAAGEVGTTIEWWYENLHPEDRERVVSSIHAVVDGISEFWSEEYRFRRGDGTYATVLDRGYVVRNEKGGPVRMIGSMMDITERKRVEEAQRFLARASTLLDASLDSEAILASLARLAVPPVADYCLIDMAEESGGARRVASAHVDPEKERFLLTDERWPADADMKHHPVVSVLRTGRSVIVPKVTDSVLKTIAPDPKYRKALQKLGLRSFIVVPLIAHERALGAITLAAAESGRHYSALDVMLAEDLARRAALAVENARLYWEAQQAVRARDEMLAVVSHDLRNPLNGITMGVSLLLDTTDERRSSNVKTLRLIKRSAEQMNHLIQDLLDVSKIEAGRFPVDAASHSVASLMTDTGELFQPLVSKKKIRLESEVPASLPAIHVDRDRILQVFSNLIGNAIKFTPEGGAITIRAEPLEAEVCFSVADTGSGIPPEQLPHVFNRYWQAKRGDHRGAGLGLTIAKGIVEAHGGRIWVESTVEEGTTFFFTVPVGSD
jgi:PAS domain S-box-containing protein